MRTPLAMILLSALFSASAAGVPDPGTEFQAQAAKLTAKNPKAWLKLADFAEEHLLWDRREEALRKALAQDPENAEAHARLDEARVGKAWLPAAEAEAREAEAQQAKGLVFYGKGWIKAKEAEALRDADRKLAGWPVETRLDTAHLRIYSARPLPFTRRVAAVLEGEVETYRRFYGRTLRLDPVPLVLKVYVFADPDTYERIAKEAAPSGILPGNGGCYWNTTRILYVGNPGGSEEIALVTAAHEMVHALDDLSAHVYVGVNSAGAMWLTEGRADHLGYGIRGRRILPGGAVIPAGDATLRLLAESVEGADIRKVMRLDQASFSGGSDQEAARNYAIAWAWVHFLFHGEGGKHAPGFHAYLKGIPRRISVADFEKAVGPLAELEPAFKRHVKETLLPAAESPTLDPSATRGEETAEGTMTP